MRTFRLLHPGFRVNTLGYDEATGSRRLSMAMVTDPVCGMKIDTDDAAATAEYEGKTYYFCSQVCHDVFMTDPLAYAD
jgi:YHS domain-containing protein